MHIDNSIATFRIDSLTTQAIIGCNEWERHKPQEVIIDIVFKADISMAIASDRLENTVDYRALKKRILQEVNASAFYLLERLTSHILGMVLSDPKVIWASVRVQKPNALRFAKSVSIELSGEKHE